MEDINKVLEETSVPILPPTSKDEGKKERLIKAIKEVYLSTEKLADEQR